MRWSVWFVSHKTFTVVLIGNLYYARIYIKPCQVKTFFKTFLSSATSPGPKTTYCKPCSWISCSGTQPTGVSIWPGEGDLLLDAADVCIQNFRFVGIVGPSCKYVSNGRLKGVSLLHINWEKCSQIVLFQRGYSVFNFLLCFLERESKLSVLHTRLFILNGICCTAL